MYKFKYYYKNGNIKFRDTNNEIQKLLKDNNMKKLHNTLDSTLKEYEKNFNDIYRIDIIENESNKVIDYIDKSECLVNGKKGHIIYDAFTTDEISVIVDQNYDTNKYKFKFYYNDSSTDTTSASTDKPEKLYLDFDGLMDWDEYYALDEKDLSTREVLELASKVYKGFLPDFHRIEIINYKTNEIIDYIDLQNQ